MYYYKIAKINFIFCVFEQSPRRNCCRVMKSRNGAGRMEIDVGVCREGEVSEI